MAKSYNGGINLTTSYKLNNPSPIADYMVVQAIADLSTIPYQFVGMVVFVEADENTYVKKTTGWEAISKGFNEVYVGSVEPTDTEELWINPDDDNTADIPAKTREIANVTLSGSWVADGSIFKYEYSNGYITADNFVDIIPSNTTIDISEAAELLPTTVSSAGKVTFWAKNIPTANIIVTIHIYE